MKLTFDINLQRMALLASAQALWDQESVKNEIKEIFLGMNITGNLDKWVNLTKENIKSIPPSSLPADLYGQLVYIVKDIGGRIYDWYFYLRNIHFLGYKFTEDTFNKYLIKIHWTNIGTIDEAQTLKSCWLNNPEIDVFKLFLMACSFCEEDIIDMMWEKLPESVRSADYSKFYKAESSQILAYWISHKRSTLNNFVEDVNRINDRPTFDVNKSAEENLISKAVDRGNYLITQCIWEKLNDEQKQNIGPYLFELGLSAYDCSNHDRLYARDKFAQIYVYLFNNTTMDVKMDAFKKWGTRDMGLVTFFEVLTSSYPWQELVAPAFKQLMPLFKEHHVIAIFRKVILLMRSNCSFDLPVKNGIMQRQFSLMWKELPSKFKLPVAEKFLFVLFDIWDVRNVKLILNDKDLYRKREELLRIGYKKLMELAEGNQNEMISEFVEELLIMKNWEVGIKEKLKKLYDIIMFKYDIDEAKVFLDSNIDSEEEKIKFLEKLNHEFLCYYYVRQNAVECLSEHFEWLFPLEDHVNLFKQNILNNEFTLSLIYEIWSTCPRFQRGWGWGPKNLCDEFLNWLFDYQDDEIINFKKNVILKTLEPDNWKKLRELFIKSDSYEITSHFLSWCFCSEADIEKIKKESLGNYLFNACGKFLRKNWLGNAQRLLNWVFKSDDEKQHFIHDFVTSEEGLKALKFVIGTASSQQTDALLKKEELSKRFKDVISFWIKPLGSIILVHKHLTELCEAKKKEDAELDVDSNASDNVGIDLEEWESVFLDIDFEYDCNSDFLIWEEENFNLFLALLTEVRANYSPPLKNNNPDGDEVKNEK